ncbi:GNAT family N-acetyltransferase [Lyngbya confervoides]|uniref:GNAT family N-acetyltransferase n=1 Tax=Lyngbya confervoides BDU141951 TaxID=1574623 RepID=A0ABD4T257_9CYAN|nr:GNAT family N-acetyltransferase [Lyngbya confervoides]MCM1982711.1 GNAT family N-acetyltransferase [Lyngbya confervoides BDU141951]
MELRNATLADLPAIVEIYNQSIPSRQATADTEAVSVDSRLDWFAAHNSPQRPLWVCALSRRPEGPPLELGIPETGTLETGIIAGWISLNSFYGRPAYRDTVEVSLYVHSAYQRQGMGRYMLSEMVQYSQQQGLRALLGFIFAHNQPSLALFRGLQFQNWGYLPQVAVLDGACRDLVILGRSLCP